MTDILITEDIQINILPGRLEKFIEESHPGATDMETGGTTNMITRIVETMEGTQMAEEEILMMTIATTKEMVTGSN
jgi:hypothetical protein